MLLTDILHAFAQNPVAPCLRRRLARAAVAAALRRVYAAMPSGVHSIGFAGDGYSFDNEGPAHQVFIGPVRIARRLVAQCAVAGVHRGRRLRDAVALAVRRLGDGRDGETGQAPGYWRNIDGAWFTLTLGGLHPVDPATRR